VYNFPSTSAVATSCEKLLEVYRLPDSGSNTHKDDEWLKDDTQVNDEDEDDEEFVTGLDPTTDNDTADDSDNLDPPSAPLPTHLDLQPNRSKRKSPPYCKVIQRRLGALLYALFSQLPSPECKGRFFSPLFRYLVLASFGADGKWAVAGDTTQHIAALLFTGRLTLYSKMHEGLSIAAHEDYHS
jgi:hypothetical protein